MKSLIFLILSVVASSILTARANKMKLMPVEELRKIDSNNEKVFKNDKIMVPENSPLHHKLQISLKLDF